MVEPSGVRAVGRTLGGCRSVGVGRFRSVPVDAGRCRSVSVCRSVGPAVGHSGCQIPSLSVGIGRSVGRAAVGRAIGRSVKLSVGRSAAGRPGGRSGCRCRCRSIQVGVGQTGSVGSAGGPNCRKARADFLVTVGFSEGLSGGGGGVDRQPDGDQRPPRRRESPEFWPHPVDLKFARMPLLYIMHDRQHAISVHDRRTTCNRCARGGSSNGYLKDVDEGRRWPAPSLMSRIPARRRALKARCRTTFQASKQAARRSNPKTGARCVFHTKRGVPRTRPMPGLCEQHAGEIGPNIPSQGVNLAEWERMHQKSRVRARGTNKGS